MSFIEGIGMEKRITLYLSSIAVVLAFVVVVLGAYTRLTHAGLGCPDWPGCYGKMVVPATPHAISHAEKLFPARPIEPTKAWTEMVHRYAAGTLGMIILSLFVLAWRGKASDKRKVVLPSVIVALVALQAALGRWTVTWKLLPTVVMGHLLGGLTILACLWWLRLRVTKVEGKLEAVSSLPIRGWAVAGMIIVFSQIALGGWVSANYAGLSCVGLPFCNGSMLPHLNFHGAFVFATSIGKNYQGGVLDSSTRMTIQVIHRIGAAVTLLYVVSLAIWVMRKTRSIWQKKIAISMLSLVGLQFVLGVINVIDYLPLSIAVAHNAVAALLLLSLVTLLYSAAVRQEV